DDPLQVFLGQRCGHELLENRKLTVLLRGLLLPARGAKRLGRLDPALALTLEHLELLVVGERALELLLGRAQAREDQPEGIAARGIAGEGRLLDVLLDLAYQAHSCVTSVLLSGSSVPCTCLCPSTCQWR